MIRFPRWAMGAKRRPAKQERPLNIRCESYIEAGLAAKAAGGASGHWLVCQRCAFEWKDQLKPESGSDRYWCYWHYCPRCGVQERGSRILAEFVKGLASAASVPKAPPDPPSEIP